MSGLATVALLLLATLSVDTPRVEYSFYMLLLGLIDIVLLVVASDFSWRLRAAQIAIDAYIPVMMSAIGTPARCGPPPGAPTVESAAPPAPAPPPPHRPMSLPAAALRRANRSLNRRLRLHLFHVGVAVADARKGPARRGAADELACLAERHAAIHAARTLLAQALLVHVQPLPV